MNSQKRQPEVETTERSLASERYRWSPIRPSRSLAVRLALASGLVITAILTNRSFLGWGLFVLFAILVVPIGRARSFAISFVPYAAVWFAFTAMRSLADETALADSLSSVVGNFERRLFGGRLPSIMLQDRFYDRNHLHWYDYLCTFVHWSYFVIPHAVAIRTWYKDPMLFRRYLASMTMVLAIGLALYFMIPSRPPWNLPEELSSPSQPVVQRIMAKVGKQLGGGLYQATYDVIGESNPWAAMPSIHMAITVLLVFPAFRAGRRWGYLALAYAALMGYSLVYLGEHYVVDVTIGTVISTYSWYAVGTWSRRVAPLVRPVRRRPPEHSLADA
ncbi:MAG TPA: phosphatase PAP2 family protein [Thermomicrobiales bacterium]